MKNLISPIICVLLFITLSAFIPSPQQVTPPTPPSKIDMANWMKDLYPLIGNWELSKIAMPGTHDSNMYKGLPAPTEPTKNQTLDLVGQLNAGARYLDFRIGYIYNGCDCFPKGSFKYYNKEKTSNDKDAPAKGNECYSCPKGYEKVITQKPGSPKACRKPAKEVFKKATKHKKGTGFLGTDCPSGQFWDPNSYCYSCPSGYKRTAHAVTSSKACSKVEKEKFARASYQGPYLNPNVPYNMVSLMTKDPNKIIMMTGTMISSPDWYLRGHGDVHIDVKVKDALTQIKNWIKAHPTEVVILRVGANDYSGENGDYDKIFRDQLGSYLHPAKSNIGSLKLKDVRGKVIVIDNKFAPAGSNVTKKGYDDDHGGHSKASLYLSYVKSKAKELFPKNRTNFNKLHVLSSCLTPFGTGGGLENGILATPYQLESEWNPKHKKLLENDWKGLSINVISIDFIKNFGKLEKLIVEANYNQPWAK